MLEPCPTKYCPFCGRSFKALGIHLKHCPKRGGQDYQVYLSEKTRTKKEDAPKMKVCNNCGRRFKRLDVHLRNSATCRQVPQSPWQVSSGVIYCTPQNHAAFSPCDYTSISKPFIYPNFKEEWLTAGNHFATTIVSAVPSASTVDQKHQTLCSGIYNYFSRVCGTLSSKSSLRRRQRSKQSKSKNISELRMERNKARQQLRKAKHSSSDPQIIRELAIIFHHSLRQYSRARKAKECSLQQTNQLKARKDCSQNFWKLASRTLDNSNSSIQPSFDESIADEFFRTLLVVSQKFFSNPLGFLLLLLHRYLSILMILPLLKYSG